MDSLEGEEGKGICYLEGSDTNACCVISSNIDQNTTTSKQFDFKVKNFLRTKAYHVAYTLYLWLFSNGKPCLSCFLKSNKGLLLGS